MFLQVKRWSSGGFKLRSPHYSLFNGLFDRQDFFYILCLLLTCAFFTKPSLGQILCSLYILSLKYTAHIYSWQHWSPSTQKHCCITLVLIYVMKIQAMEELHCIERASPFNFKNEINLLQARKKMVQFKPDKLGQFQPDKVGQGKSELLDQCNRILHPACYV